MTETKGVKELEELLKRTYERAVGVFLIMMGFLCFISGILGWLWINIILDYTLIPYYAGERLAVPQVFMVLWTAAGFFMTIIGLGEYFKKEFYGSRGEKT